MRRTKLGSEMMREVDDGIPVPPEILKVADRSRLRAAALQIAKEVYAAGGVGKSTAAKIAIGRVGLWAVIQPQSAIDYLRNNI
jgi:hypothetical protein